MILRSVSFALLSITALVGSAEKQTQAEGKNLYGTYCAACHGDSGKGDGVAAKGLPAKPADHTNGAVMSRLSDKFLIDVISKGGSAVGKSPFMPAWGGSLNDKQIRDIVAFIRTLAAPANRAQEPANR